MFKKVLILILTISSITTTAQIRNVFYEIDLNFRDLNKVENSRYDKLEFIDNRCDTNYVGVGSSLMGIEVFGMNRANIKIFKLKQPISTQVTSYFSKLNGQNPKNGTLVYHLQKFYCVSNANSLDGPEPLIKNELVFRASFYEKKEDKYYLIQSIDTIIRPDFLKLNQKRFLLTESYKLFILTMQNCMSKEAHTAVGKTYTEVLNIDAIAKNKIPLYTNTTLADGVYENYEKLANQTPDHNITVITKEGKIDEVLTVNKNGEQEKLNTRKFYAIVYKGEAYWIYGSLLGLRYLKLEKINNTFIIAGRIPLFNLSTRVASDFFIKESRKILNPRFGDPYCVAELDCYDGSLIFTKISWKEHK